VSYADNAEFWVQGLLMWDLTDSRVWRRSHEEILRDAVANSGIRSIDFHEQVGMRNTLRRQSGELALELHNLPVKAIAERR
jgi:hypothetical protein